MNLREVWLYFVEQYLEAMAKNEREQGQMFYQMSQVIWQEMRVKQ